MRRYIIFCIVLIRFTFSIKAQVPIYKSTNSTTINNDCVSGDCKNKYGRMKWSNSDSFTGFFKNGNMFMGTYLFDN
ncbi:MAG: hypothetical protein IIB06_05035 [Bacteroidetes bacterium]|nr:hypothetical protein [Bacteroidota bacterium]